MKMSKKFRAIASAALISAMVMSMNGITALAEGSSDVTFTKKVTTDGNTYAPDTSFVFDIGVGTPSEAGRTPVIYGNSDVPSNGLSFNSSSVVQTISLKFDPTQEGMTNLASEYSKTGSLYVDIDKFSKPGLYHYTLTEQGGTYDGISYDTKRDVFVFIESDDNGNLSVGYVGATNEQAEDGKADLIFVNDYGKDNDGTHDVIITKNVTGNQGNRTNKTFDFTVKVTGSTNENGELTSGQYEQYKVEYGTLNEDKSGWKTNPTTLTIVNGKDSSKIPLKHGESIRIYGLSNGDTYTVTEDSYESDGYKTYVDGRLDEQNKEKTEQSRIATGHVTVDGTERIVENYKNVTTPTGIVMTFGPYALLLALAGVFAVMFLRKKREDF